jgi:uridine kinase
LAESAAREVIPEGYYYDSFNYQKLAESILVPLGPRGSLQYRAAVFDHHQDLEVQSPIRMAEITAVLIFDGVFLLRPELVDFWDFTIFVEAAFETSLARAEQRDAAVFGSVEEVRSRYQRRTYLVRSSTLTSVDRKSERQLWLITMIL